MHMFEVVNDNNKVVLDDTQTCLHLKYLLKYSKNSLSKISVSSVKGWAPNFKKDYFYAPNTYTGNGYMTALRIQVPITKRDKDEFYLYSLHFPHETPSFATSEIVSTDDNNAVKYPLFVLTLYVPQDTDIEAVIEDLEIYVYSSKTHKKSNFGLEIFDENSNIIFSSALYYMRVIDAINKAYTAENKKTQDYYSEHSFQNVKKIGVTRINSAVPQCIAINGNTVKTYINNVYVKNNIFMPMDNQNMMYIVSELDGHKDFPVSLDLGEI